MSCQDLIGSLSFCSVWLLIEFGKSVFIRFRIDSSLDFVFYGIKIVV